MANEYAKYPDELRKLFLSVQARIVAKLDLATISEASARQKTAILKQVHDELRKLGVKASDIIKQAGPVAYTEGTAVASSFAKFGSAITAAQFTQMDTAAVDYGVKAILGDTQFALASVDRTVTSLLDSKYLSAMRNKKINRLVAQAEASGATVGELAKDLTNLVDPKWFDDYQKIQGGHLVTINGRKYRLDDYAYLSAHTRLAEVSNKGAMNWGLKHGFRFTQMSRHHGACELCKKYEGKVYTLDGQPRRDHTGTMRQSVLTLPRHGAPIHPYCRHRMMPWGRIDLDTALEYGTSATYVRAKRYGKEAGAISEGNKIAA